MAGSDVEGEPSRSRSGRVASTASTTSQAPAAMPQARPKRVPRTSTNVSGRAADQKVAPWPIAPCRITASSADTKPAIAANSRMRSSRAVKGRETTPAGRQQTRKKISPPRPMAIAAYWTARATESAVFVTGPASPSEASSWSSEAVGVTPLPTVKT